MQQSLMMKLIAKMLEKQERMPIFMEYATGHCDALQMVHCGAFQVRLFCFAKDKVYFQPPCVYPRFQVSRQTIVIDSPP